jgi:hypothetical protein
LGNKLERTVFGSKTDFSSMVDWGDKWALSTSCYFGKIWEGENDSLKIALMYCPIR